MEGLIDFNDMNEACPKDIFPLPHIDQIVDATSGHKMLSFMDAFSYYNQIPMYPPDLKKTTFITLFGTFCYHVVTFGLKNARVTYQRLMKKYSIQCQAKQWKFIYKICL